VSLLDGFKEGPVIHNERIDRLAALLVRYMSRFNRVSPASVVDRHRVARLRTALAAALAEAKERILRRPASPRPVSTFAWRWLIPLNLPIRFRRPTDSWS
jgi:hypothetical protein